MQELSCELTENWVSTYNWLSTYAFATFNLWEEGVKKGVVKFDGQVLASEIDKKSGFKNQGALP